MLEEKRTKLSDSGDNRSKQKAKAVKKQREAVSNKKHKNNKVLKAKEILAANKTALAKESEKREEAAKHSLPVRILLTVKKVFFGILIAVLAVALISFVVIRVSGGTPTVFGYSVQRIVSGSMEPSLRVGDIILSKSVSDPAEIAVGDIVTFDGGEQYDNKKITHRVIAQPTLLPDGEYYLTTMGDANETPDNEISFKDVNSKCLTKLDFLNKFYDFFMSPWGLIIFIAALIIIFFDELLTVVKVITGNYKEDEEDDDESIGEIMKRLKREEEERLRAEEERKARGRTRDNTSKKKIKNRSESNKKPIKQKKKKNNSGNKASNKKSKKKKK